MAQSANLITKIGFGVDSKEYTMTGQGTSAIDAALGVQPFVSSLSSSTSMAYVNPNKLLVLKKGQVKLISNGQLKQQQVPEVPHSSDFGI